MTTTRLQYIDALRGIAVLMIVYGHLHMSYGDDGSSFTFRAMTGMLRLPLLFFVSGFVFTSKPMGWRHGGGYFVLRKARQLLLPAVVIGGVFAMVHGLPARTMLIDTWKGGYWFMLTLFEYMVVQTAVECATGSDAAKRTTLRYAAALLAATAVLYALSLAPVSRRAGDMGEMLQLSKLRYFVYFAAGRLLRQHMTQLLRWPRRDIAVALTVTTFVVLAIGSWGGVGVGTGSGPWFYLRLVLFEMTAVLTVFCLFYRHRAWFASDGRLPRTLALVGRRTLEIYLMHYFLLPKDLHVVGRYFAEHPAPVVEFIIAGVIAITIAAVCLLVGELLRSSTFLHRWVLGGK